MKRFYAISLVLLMVLAIPALTFAQDKQQTTDQSKEQQDAQAKMQAEMQLINQIQANQRDPEMVSKLAEEFIQKYPDSQNLAYVEYVATLAYQSLNNFPKMEEHALKAMQLLPNNPVIPATLAYGYAENKEIDKAEQMATKAMGEVEALQKPANTTQEMWDAQLNQIRDTIHATLGYVHLQRALELEKNKKTDDAKAELDKSTAEFQKAITANPKDDISYYRMGQAFAMALQIDKNLDADAQSKLVDQSLDAYAKAVVLNGPASPRAKTDMEEIFKSLEKAKQLNDRSMEKCLAKAKQELGIQ